ncbi:OmpA family protein [Teredinibacter waterburyi]|uniref:OmpA family protein n=1 Tax=Teredinibacter waterburyi TaxID=1500538 RepID=UPI00166006B0|nr:OmpA family protein [Teredinibacter waterburyi]
MDHNNNQSKKISTLKPLALAVASAALIAAPLSNAGDVQDSGFTLTPSVGYITHDSNRQGVEDTASMSLAGGYQFNSPWAVELAYLTSEPEISGTNLDADSDQLRLDALYHFGKGEKAQPYAVFGLGESDIKSGGSSFDDVFVNAGLGLKYAFNDVVSLRTDVRAIQQKDSDAFQAAVNLGVSFLLGGKSSGTSTTKDDNKDSDRDGVLDRVDACPGTDQNTPVDTSGCPLVLDADGDGVQDKNDICPDTKAGAKVDGRGCYMTLKEDVTVALNVNFANNSDVIVSESNAKILELASFMKQFPMSKVEIKGHTDDRGAASYNKNLSQLRANAVKKVLVEKHGIDANRVTAIGYGEVQPIADNNTAAGRASNRRVEAQVSATVEKTIQ